MRPLIQNFLTPKPNPIGIDFGTDFLRVVQIRRESAKLRLIAAEEYIIPDEAKKDWTNRLEFFSQSLPEMLASGKFVGRQVILGLPAASTHFGHLRLAKMDEKALTEALPWEIKGKLSIEPGNAVIRHIVAGEVFVDQEARDEIIVMASPRQVVQGILATAQKAKLDVMGMNVEVGAIVECFAQVYRRKEDAEATNCFLDIGANGSRVIVSKGRQILFVRAIPLGSGQLNQAIAADVKLHALEEAQLQHRIVERPTEALALAATTSSSGSVVEDERRRDLREIEGIENADTAISAATAELVEKIVDELTLCRRYYDSAFPNNPIDRLIFVGGGASDRRLCQDIARGVEMPAQVGDPLVRVEGREIVDEGAKRPQPAWAVAMGLSIGGVV